MIRPASPGLEIYYLFHKEPVRGLILKYSPPPSSPEFLLNGYSVKKNATHDPLPHTSLYQLHVAR